MTPGRPAAMRGGWRFWCPGLGRLLARGLLVTAVCGPASADEQAVTALLKPLHLVGYRAGTKPPHFGGLTPDARPLSMTDLRGKVVVVNFWASWCHECRPEMPALERLHREFASRGLAIIGINAREEAATIRRYAKELGLTFPAYPRSGRQDQRAVRSGRSAGDLRRRSRRTRRRVRHRFPRVGERAGASAHRGAAGRAGSAPGRAMTRRRLSLLVLGVVLATAGLIGHGIAAQPHRLIKIGALTESWGPTPAIVGLRDGLRSLDTARTRIS